MYQRPTKGDLDRNLSTIMHAARHKAEAERNRITSEYAARGMGLSTSLVQAVTNGVNDIHQRSMTEAMRLLHEFHPSAKVTPTQAIDWARPHLQNMGTTLLGVIRPAGFPEFLQKTRTQYLVVFQQRLENAFKDLAVGYIDGQNVKPPEKARGELFGLKLEWHGISIDLYEAGSRFRNWWKSLFRN